MNIIITGIIFWIVCGSIAAPIASRLFEEKYKNLDTTEEIVASFFLGPIALIIVLTTLVINKYRK